MKLKHRNSHGLDLSTVSLVKLAIRNLSLKEEYLLMLGEVLDNGLFKHRLFTTKRLNLAGC